MPIQENLLELTNMNALETNVFPILNQAELKMPYRLYRVRGLSQEQKDYHRNLNILVRQVARRLKTSVTSLERERQPWLVICDALTEPDEQQMLVRRTVMLERQSEQFVLDFGNLGKDEGPIAARFLQAKIEKELHHQRELWQPKSGAAFCEKPAWEILRGIGLHRGFLVRILELEEGRLGVCVDVRNKYVSAEPLPSRMTRQDFRRFRMRRAIYHYGHEWYEIRMAEWSDLTAEEHLIVLNGRQLNLVQYVQEQSAKPLPPELVALPQSCGVVGYYNSRNESRFAPSALCFLSFDSEDPRVKKSHGRTLLSPEARRAQTRSFLQESLDELTLGGVTLKVGIAPERALARQFPVPDFKFGDGKILSTKGTSGAEPVTLGNLGRRRLEILLDKSAGFFVNDPLLRQFFFMPQTIYEAWGKLFLRELGKAVDDLYPQEYPYDPQVICYDDRSGTTFLDQGEAILQAARGHSAKSGFAVVMIHEPSDRRPRHHDQLAAFVLREFTKLLDTPVAVIHTAVGSECYELRRDERNEMAYVRRRDKRGKLDGYLRNVALNKVLLTNEKWPFVLAEPLHAELTIGVDVKNHFAGFTVVGKGGAYISTHGDECSHAERLKADEFEDLLRECVEAYFNRTGEFAKRIVIHRDGRMFETEIEGANTAVEYLKANMFLAPAAELTCLEIGKSSAISVRLFDVRNGSANGTTVLNPEVGQHFIPNSQEGYLCATGRAFPRPGTVEPLHVRKVSGSLPFDACMEDVYRLTTLAWSRPEDCTRLPITIKLNDRRLVEDASEYGEAAPEADEEEVVHE